MLIPKYHRQVLRKMGLHRWFWTRVPNWAYGERYRFQDCSIAYLMDGEIITIRRGDKILYRREK